MKTLTKKERRRLNEVADKFLKVLKERVDSYVFLGDIDALDRLVSQVNIIGAYEVIKVLRDKGLSKDITRLCDKAGKISERVKEGTTP